MKGLDNFINVLSVNHVCTKKFADNAPEPDEILEKLREVLSENVANEINDMLSNYTCVLEMYSVAEGMKTAIEIMNGEYIVEI